MAANNTPATTNTAVITNVAATPLAIATTIAIAGSIDIMVTITVTTFTAITFTSVTTTTTTLSDATIARLMANSATAVAGANNIPQTVTRQDQVEALDQEDDPLAHLPTPYKRKLEESGDDVEKLARGRGLRRQDHTSTKDLKSTLGSKSSRDFNASPFGSSRDLGGTHASGVEENLPENR